MATYAKNFLSASDNGRGIKVVATASAGTQIHAAHATAKDEIWLWATNTDTVDRDLTIQYGGTTSPDDNIKHTIPAGQQILVCAGLILSNSLVVRAFGSAANIINITGFVNRIS